MKIFRVSAATVTLAALSLLAACGGGGGGGGVTPGGGGNGGGGGPTPTPTPISTATPTPTPTPTPNGAVITAEEDWGPNGDSTWYTSGITASWTNHAGDTSTGASGSFSPMDGMSCQAITEGTTYSQTAYSQHAFVGIYYNGAEKALPQAIGMDNPTEPTQSGHPNDNYEVESNTCEYQVHTHDYSGLVHIADPSLPQSTTNAPSYATLQSLLDLWGATYSSSNGLTAGANSLSGSATIYVGTPSYTNSSGDDFVQTYSQVSSPSAVVLNHHTAVWIVIGSAPTGGLPQVKFVVEN